jgi:hypothetical protein
MVYGSNIRILGDSYILEHLSGIIDTDPTRLDFPEEAHHYVVLHN